MDSGRNASSSDEESQQVKFVYSAAEDEEDSRPSLMRRTTNGNGPPESILDWTQESSSLASQNREKQEAIWNSVRQKFLKLAKILELRIYREFIISYLLRYFQQLYLMCNKLNDFEFEDEIFEQMIIPMKLNFQKYFTEIASVTYVAALNLCYNVAGVQTLIDSIVHDLGLDDEDPYFARNVKQDFNIFFGYMFDYYLVKYGTTSHIHQSMASSSLGSSKNPLMFLCNTLRNGNSKRAHGNTPSNELGRYSGTDFISTIRKEVFEDFDVLAWWQGRESQFPVLAAMTRDLITVQATTVASEFVFSLSGRVLSIRRTILTPKSLEMCICLKDHLNETKRIQNVATLKDELDVEEEIHEYEVSQGTTAPLSDEEQAYDDSQRGSSGSDS